ncbi:alpha/beta hydrolase [Paenibacillus sp. TRM 82003]|nr:alpha/beta hydrolase [Paenibacillus sp. TRM 82003]
MKRYKSPEGKRLIIDSYDALLNSWGVPFEERDIGTTYGETHIITTGDAGNQPLLLFHGTADNSAMMWIYNIYDLTRHFYVIAVDAIGGSGKSEPNDQYYKNFDQVKWIDEILDSLDIRSTNICGVSYGAYLAYYYTVNRPEVINKAICLAGRIPSSQYEVFSKMIGAFLPEALWPSERNSKKLLRKLCGSNYIVFEQNEELMKHSYYLLKYFNNKSMMYHGITMIDNAAITGLREKVMFIIGDRDTLSNYPKAIRKLEENKLQFKIIEDTGHAINHEQAFLINKEIVEFINEQRDKGDQ